MNETSSRKVTKRSVAVCCFARRIWQYNGNISAPDKQNAPHSRGRGRLCNLSGCGAKGRARTGDPRIFSAMLYQLSYLGSERHPTLLVGDDGFEPPTPSV